MKTLMNDRMAYTAAATTQRLSSKTRVVVTAIALALAGISSSALAQNVAISQGYLTGTWKENQQCAGNEAMVFFPNNTMSSAGSIPVNYAVTGPAQFTMHGPGGAVNIQAQALNQNQMVVTFQNGTSVFYRCGTANNNAYMGNNNAYAGNNIQGTIVGGWGFNGNCGITEVFTPHGQFRSSNNDWGRWALAGNLVSLTMDNGVRLDFSIQNIGPQHLTLMQNNNGQISNYTRCH